MCTVLLNQPRVRFISPSHTVVYTFSNPPLTLTSFTASPNPVLEFSQTSLTATYTGGVGPFTCKFRFGDGQSATVNSTTNTCSVTHIYLDDNIYNATVRLAGVNTSDRIVGIMLVQVLEDHPLIAPLASPSESLTPQLPSTIRGIMHSR